MKLLFSTSKASIYSAGIRLLTWSQWSHVDILSPDGKDVVGAVAGRGVECVSLASRLRESRRVAVMYVTNASAKVAWRYALSQVGKPYDYGAILGFLAHRHWAEDGRWFCSELAAAAALHARAKLFDPNLCWRVTPQMLWMLDYPRCELGINR